MWKIIRRFWRRYVLNHWWSPRRCGWPHPDGYCAYNPHTRTLLESGLTEQQAKNICAMMNAYL